MATREDIFYKPDIQPPIRKRDQIPEKIRMDNEEKAKRIQVIADELNIPVEDVPDDPFTLLKNRFIELEETGKELANRATFLLDKTIEDLEGYVGDAPAIILKYLEELTGRTFSHIIMVEESGVPDKIRKRVMKPKTDDVYTLDPCTMKCIGRVAGIYHPSETQANIADAVNNNDTDKVESMLNDLQESDDMVETVFGLKLLILVLKMSFVITVHSTVGYICGWIEEQKKLKKFLDVVSSFVGVPKLGTMLQKLFRTAEITLLSIVGYRCGMVGEPPPSCDSESWQKTDIKHVNCCTTRPIFFGTDQGNNMDFNMDMCFQKWIDEELYPSGRGKRTICNSENCSNDTIVATNEEKAKAKEVFKYIQESNSRHNVMNPSDIQPLSKAIDHARTGTMMAQHSQSAIDTVRDYTYTGNKNAPWDCFGYTRGSIDRENEIMEAVNEAAEKWTTSGTENPIYVKSIFAFDYFKLIDDVITKSLELADKTVISVSNLSKFGASTQLCCYVYLIVLIATLVESLIAKGTICTQGDLMSNVREELKWAVSRDGGLRNDETVQTLVQILDVIKQIIDVFRNKMNRSIFLAGLQLPLSEMWELIKLTLSNGLSQMLDVILSPIDQVLSGIKGLPEVRHTINNDCFGVGKLFDFLQCLLGNLKWGTVNWVMQFLDFTLKDFTLIDDIYLSRVKMAFLDSLSDLLGNMINLILSLRDCYDPSDLTNQMVAKQMQLQYTNTINYYEVMKTQSDIEYADKCSESIMGQTLLPDAESQEQIEGLDGSLSSILSSLGFSEFPEKVVMNTITDITKQPIELSLFADIASEEYKSGNAANIVDFGEFVTKMEEITGVKTTEVKESLRYIFDILKGESNVI